MSDVAQYSAFSTADLMSVVQILKRPTNGILKTFFPSVSQSQKEYIEFDVDEQKRYVAPFVHSRVTGKLRTPRGQESKIFTPAYIKLKAAFDPNRAFTRAAGEAFMGTLTPQERLDMAVQAHLQDDVDAVDRRLELMAISALLNGQLTITGDDYPTRVVDFLRHAKLGLSQNTAGAADKWNVASSDPLGFLDDRSESCVQLASSTTPDVVMDSDAWKAFKTHPKVKEALDLLKYDAGTLSSITPQQEGLVLRGQVGGYRIWTYAGWVLDDKKGVEAKSLSGGYVMGVGAIDGIQHFGAIRDLKAMREYPEGVPLPVYVKSWEEEDPSTLVVLTQSAPLVVPRRVNASWAAKVL